MIHFKKHPSLFRFLLCLFLLGSGLGEAAINSSTGVARYSNRGNSLMLNLTGGLVTTGGEYGGSFLMGVSLPVQRNSPVRLGLDTGVMFSKGVALPILVSIMYQFEGQPTVHPYVAGTLGPVIGLSSTAGTLFGETRDFVIGNGIKLAILVRPGLRFNVAENLDLNVETALGGMTGIFYITPSLGLSLRV